jgi:cytochrome c oxidase subunit II
MGRLLAIAIWVITILSVWMFVSGKWWFPESISEHGHNVDSQFLITILVVGLSFTAAQVGLGWVVWKFRDNASAQRATYSHGNNRLEVVWTVVTAVIFISLAVMGQRVWASLHLHSAPPGSTQIEVVAQQFSWNFHYPGKDKVFGRTDPNLIDDSSLNYVGLDDTDPNSKDDSVVATLVIPVNRPVELILRSKDVTHSFFVPQLRFKQDLVPGMNIRVHFTAIKTGKYELACAELCGMNHYKMKSYLLVVPGNEFDELAAMPQDQFQARKEELMNKYQLPNY